MVKADRSFVSSLFPPAPRTYDAIAPAALDIPGNGKPLFLDELRSGSMARIKENPLFQDLTTEIALANESTEKNRVSLNEKVRKNELAEITQLRAKSDSDRKAARALDRNKYYQLTLADAEKTELKQIKHQSEADASAQAAAADDTQSILEPPGGVPNKSNFDPMTENEAITHETLNIPSDLVSLTRARQMATGHLGKGGAATD